MNPLAMSSLLVCLSIAAACQSAGPAKPPVAAAAPGAAPSPSAPAAGPRPAAALEPLAFMAGAWTQQQANGAMIEEHWMAPRGASMLGSFRRILGNGAVPCMGGA